MTKVRNSSYELLKIVCMLMIVMGHLISHSSIAKNSVGLWSITFTIIQAILIVHVNCFVLITGYFQCKNKFKFNKILFLNNKAWFYRIAFLILFLIFGSISIGKIEMINYLFPLPILSEDIWFFRVYLLLYLLSPFLNKFFSCLNKREFKIYLFAIIILFSVIPTITNEMLFYSANGYSIQNFILLYSIGAYLRNYPLDTSTIFSKHPKLKPRYTYIFMFVICFVLNFGIYALGVKAFNISEHMGLMLTSRIYTYDNPLVILGAVSLFSLFGTLNLKSTLINDIAGLTFGVYLIHENYFVREIIYDVLGLNNITYDFGLFIKIICFTLIVFLVCITIDYFVNKLLLFISKRKIIVKIKDKSVEIFNKFYFRGEA